MRLVEQGLVETRAKAQAVILAGDVSLGTDRVDKAGALVAADAQLQLRTGPRYVSRGGLKLESALSQLQIDPTGKVCVDVGASTGGFTDCLLQHGATKVYAVDVGQGLLANKLIQDSRVHVMDRTNARNLEPDHFEEQIQLVVVDASFIGIGKLVDALARVLSPRQHLLAMIKPQFEIGREQAHQTKGVVSDPVMRRQAISKAEQEIAAAGFSLLAGCDSGLAGPKGNVEYFAYSVRQDLHGHADASL